MKQQQIWRSIARITDHPSNGQGVGGAIINTVFAVLVCGHSRAYPKSKAPSGRGKVRCRECEKST